MNKRKSRFRTVMVLILSFVLALSMSACIDNIKRGYLTVNANEDGYTYDYYVPGSYSSKTVVPLFVVLHGGTQTAEDMANMTQMNALADEYNFIVLYPEQSTFANAYRYWNWFMAANQIRESGEPKVIAEMILSIKQDYQIDDEKVFIAGFSAGACMALTMGILYPDLIKGVALASGLGYATASDGGNAYQAMNGTLPDFKNTAEMALDNMPVEYRHPVKVLVFHGDADTRVDVVNAQYIIDQISYLNDLIDDGVENESFDHHPDSVLEATNDHEVAYSVATYLDASGAIILQKYIVSGMAHRWAGGDSSNGFSDSLAPDMSLILYQFMMEIDLEPVLDTD
jgi:poly(hydroxyalkanoate) depolymerase family esterase